MHVQTILCDNLISKEKLAVGHMVCGDSSSTSVACGLFCARSAAAASTFTGDALPVRRTTKALLLWEPCLDIRGNAVHVSS